MSSSLMPCRFQRVNGHAPLDGLFQSARLQDGPKGRERVGPLRVPGDEFLGRRRRIGMARHVQLDALAKILYIFLD